MIFPIRVGSMKAAEELSAVCKQFPREMYLRSGAYCIDPKSTLGILAIMYSAPDRMALDAGEMPPEELARLRAALAPFLAE